MDRADVYDVAGESATTLDAASAGARANVVTLDTTLAGDFGGGPGIVDTGVDNPSPSDHAVGGYLRAPQVHTRVAAVHAG